MKRIIAAVGLLGMISTTGAALAYGLRGEVVGTGGSSAPPMSNGIHSVYGTVGQAVVGFTEDAAFRECAGFWCFAGSRVIAVDPTRPKLPTEFALGAAAPNPTRSEARMHLALPQSATVTLTVFDVRGRRVGETVSRPFEAGEHDLVWKAPAGAAGIYFIRLETDGVVRGKRRVVVVH